MATGYVMVICSSRDEVTVELLVRRLAQEAGLKVWFGPWDLLAGAPLQEQLERAVAGADACLVCIGSPGIGGWYNEQLRVAIDRRVTEATALPVVPVILPGASEDALSELPRLLRRYVPVTFDAPDDPQAFRLLVAGALGLRPIEVDPLLAAAPVRLPATRTAPTEAERNVPLKLTFLSQPAGAVVIWESDVLGRRVSQFQAPYDERQLPLVIQALELAQHPAGAPGLGPVEREQLRDSELLVGDWPAEDLHRRVGRALYKALTADPAAALALHMVRDHATALGLALAFQLHFDGPALAALPWELLWDEGGPVLFSRGALASVVRCLDLGQALPPAPAVRRPLRLLALAPHTGVAAAVRAADEQALRVALGPMLADGALSLERLSPVTPSDLVERLQAGSPVDMFHFVGHGSYADGEGRLLLDDAQGGSRHFSAGRLAALLGEVRLAVLQSCRSSMAGGELLTGIAPALSAAGLPAVVAMQLLVRTEAALRFTSVLYGGIARGASLQRAVALGRQALYVEEPEQSSWYVPTLTLRAREPGAIYILPTPP